MLKKIAITFAISALVALILTALMLADNNNEWALGYSVGRGLAKIIIMIPVVLILGALGVGGKRFSLSRRYKDYAILVLIGAIIIGLLIFLLLVLARKYEIHF